MAAVVNVGKFVGKEVVKMAVAGVAKDHFQGDTDDTGINVEAPSSNGINRTFDASGADAAGAAHDAGGANAAGEAPGECCCLDWIVECLGAA
jgi:hypothetical protein